MLMGFRRNTNAFEGEPQGVAVDIRNCLLGVCQGNERLRVRKDSLQESDFPDDLRTGSPSLCFINLLNA